MRRKLLVLLSVCALVFPATACASTNESEKDERIAELEAQVAEQQATIEELEARIAELTAGNVSSDSDVYNIGDTWTVADQWKVTINSVEEVQERNEYADTDPAAVYMINFTYENIGYEDSNGIMNGLFIDFADGIVDAGGKMGYSYPGEIVSFPQETPTGATCEAQSCVGVDTPGSFDIHFTTYDGDGVEQAATFHCDIE